MCEVADRIKTKAERRENKKTNGNKRPNLYKLHQQVLIKNHSLSNTENKEIKKLFNIFDGPYTITKIISENTIVIRKNKDKEEIVNTAEVRPYWASNQHKELADQ